MSYGIVGRQNSLSGRQLEAADNSGSYRRNIRFQTDQFFKSGVSCHVFE
jgi:hypothetical protein